MSYVFACTWHTPLRHPPTDVLRLDIAAVLLLLYITPKQNKPFRMPCTWGRFAVEKRTKAPDSGAMANFCSKLREFQFWRNFALTNSTFQAAGAWCRTTS